MASKTETRAKATDGVIPLLMATGLALATGLAGGFGAVWMFSPELLGSHIAHTPVGVTTDPSEKTEGVGKGHDQDKGVASANAAPDLVPVDLGEIDFVPFPPVIVNLTEPKQVWIRMEGGIAFMKSGDKKPELLAAESAAQITQYLKTLSLTDIEGSDGLLFLQEDVNDIVKSLSGGQVHRVLISGLIVE
jgi:flagellar protein FliL